jgi:hypothetical protein
MPYAPKCGATGKREKGRKRVRFVNTPESHLCSYVVVSILNF